MIPPEILGLAWRFLLAIALVGSPVMAMPPVDAGADLSPKVAAMPCHDAGPAVSAAAAVGDAAAAERTVAVIVGDGGRAVAQRCDITLRAMCEVAGKVLGQ